MQQTIEESSEAEKLHELLLKRFLSSRRSNNKCTFGFDRTSAVETTGLHKAVLKER
jgi:hypothetical protein